MLSHTFSITLCMASRHLEHDAHWNDVTLTACIAKLQLQLLHAKHKWTKDVVSTTLYVTQQYCSQENVVQSYLKVVKVVWILETKYGNPARRSPPTQWRLGTFISGLTFPGVFHSGSVCSMPVCIWRKWFPSWIHVRSVKLNLSF